MKVEPETELDRQIAATWPDRWAQANETRLTKSGWSSNAKRRNRLRRQFAEHLRDKYREAHPEISGLAKRDA